MSEVAIGRKSKEFVSATGERLSIPNQNIMRSSYIKQPNMQSSVTDPKYAATSSRYDQN